MTNKLCRKCDSIKPLTDFHKTAKNKDGHYCYCKVCSIRCANNRGLKKRDTLDGYIKYLTSSNKSSSKKRKIEYSLKPDTIKDLYTKQEGNCAVTQEPMTFGRKPSLTNISIDRIDNTKGYVINNVQLVCHIINTMKWTMDLKELKIWCGKILNGRED